MTRSVCALNPKRSLKRATRRPTIRPGHTAIVALVQRLTVAVRLRSLHPVLIEHAAVRLRATRRRPILRLLHRLCARIGRISTAIRPRFMLRVCVRIVQCQIAVLIELRALRLGAVL